MISKYEIDFKVAGSWLETADEHKFSAESIFKLIIPYLKKRTFTDNEDNEIHSLTNSFMLLYGLAFENILKSLVISEITDFSISIKSIEKSEKWSNKHYLIKMLKANGIEYSENGYYYLKRLEKHLIWQSKYPVSRNENESDDWSFYDNSNNVLKEIYERIKILANENIENNQQYFYSWLDNSNNNASP